MPVEIPAGREASVWKQSIYTGLRLRWVVEKLRLAVFLEDSVEVLHRNRSIRTAMDRHADAENREVGCID